MSIGSAFALHRPADGMIALARDEHTEPPLARQGVAAEGATTSFPVGELAHLGTYALAGRSARIASDAPEIVALLRPVLAPLASDATAGPLIRIARPGADHYAIRRDGHRVRVAPDLAEARHIALAELLLELSGEARVGAILHASALCGDGGAILLAGESGAGKSTLAAALAASGLGLLADDLVPLDRHATAAGAFPLALSVKEGSRAAVRRLFPGIDACPTVRTRRTDVSYLPLPAPPPGWCPIRALAFPLYRSGARLHAEPASPEEAFAFLVGTGSVPAGEPASIAPLARLAAEVPAFHLEYGDLDEAVAFLHRVPGVAA
jgi:hypothetical protein